MRRTALRECMTAEPPRPLPTTYCFWRCIRSGYVANTTERALGFRISKAQNTVFGCHEQCGTPLREPQKRMRCTKPKISCSLGGSLARYESEDIAAAPWELYQSDADHGRFALHNTPQSLIRGELEIRSRSCAAAWLAEVKWTAREETASSINSSRLNYQEIHLIWNFFA